MLKQTFLCKRQPEQVMPHIAFPVSLTMSSDEMLIFISLTIMTPPINFIVSYTQKIVKSLLNYDQKLYFIIDIKKSSSSSNFT